MTWKTTLAPDAKPQRKLLALDGGGIRGAMTLQILVELEDMLRKKHGDADLVLSDYFDAIAGTSTGAIIAACLSRGMTAADVLAFYEESGPAMFDKAGLFKRLRYKYEDEKLAGKLKETLGGDTTLGSDDLRTILVMVMRNATTDSPWPIWNNPQAKYNQADIVGRNTNLSLWKLVRASTAAPTFFPPEVIDAGGPEPFVFVDGGITMYNNPAFQLFLMCTLAPYRLGWPTGEDKMLVVSVGTGMSPAVDHELDPDSMHLLYNAGSIPNALMYAALNEQDLLCRAFGRCLVGDEIDGEIGSMHDLPTPGGHPDHFRYMRYNATLTKAGLEALGVGHIEPAHVQKLDSVEFIDELKELGSAIAATHLKPEHFDGFSA